MTDPRHPMTPGGRRPRRPRPAVRAALGALALALAFAAPAAAAQPPGMGASPAAARRALEGHTLVKLDGAKLTFAELRGEVVVVNFWASWCRPCRRELPALDELHADIAKRGGRVLAVSIDHERDNASRFVRTHELGLPVVHDGPEGLARQLDLRAVPFTLVLDRAGEVAYTTTGADDKAVAELGAVVRGLLASSPQAARIPDPETSGGTR